MIKEFQGKYRFLSNFYIEVDGTHVEGEYQAAKTLDEDAKQRFVGLTPGQAKRLGRTVPMRPDWEYVKLDIMESLVRAKFGCPVLKPMLLATGDEVLEEGNWWGDRFWGVCNGRGENHLGKILMKIREEFRKEIR